MYFACFGELSGVALNAIYSADPLTKLAEWTPEIQLSAADRVIIFARSGNDPEAVALAKQLHNAFIPFSAVASEVASETNELSELAYTYVSLKIRGGILPHPVNLGERIVMPHLMAALFVYEAIKLAFDEMIS